MPNLAVDVDSWASSACYPRSTFYPLSDGPPTWGRRITRACFRTCSACGPRSQARLRSCTQKDGCRPSRADLRAPPLPFRRRPPQSNCPPGTVPRPASRDGVRTPVRADRPERTFARLRYLLGGDRPSQTAHLARSPARLHGTGLGRRCGEGGIPRAAPRGLAPPLRCLPPILYAPDQRPMPSCSEGSRGLSVLPRVSRIFTTSGISPGPWSLRCLPPILYAPDQRPMPSCSEGSRGLSVLPRVSRIFTTSGISPGPWLRQRPSRCAFRAGRNLPDKEFRYLRTVIVTAAVSELTRQGISLP